MRKFKDIFLPATKGLTAGLMAMLLVSACSWNVDGNYDPDVELTFLPSVGMPGGEGQSVPSEGSFGLSLWQYRHENSQPEQTSGVLSTGDSRSMLEYQQIVDMSAMEWKDGCWTLPSLQFWPSKQYGILTIAYSPCSAATSCTQTDGVVFGDYDVALSPTQDLLYTQAIFSDSKGENGGAISLPFHHALTELSFRFIAHDPSISIRVREISVPAVFLCGTFRSLPAPEWRFSGESSALKYPYISPFLGSTPLGIPSIFLPPQTLTEGFVIRLSYIDPLEVEREMLVQTEALDVELKGDRRYIFTISVNPDSANVIETSIRKQNESE